MKTLSLQLKLVLLAAVLTMNFSLRAQQQAPADAAWDVLFNFEAVSPVWPFGAVETDGTYLYCTSSLYPGLFYKYTTTGTLVSSFTLSNWPAGLSGIWSMTNDGTYYYAVGYTNHILKINMATQTVVQTIPIVPVIGALTFIGYDPTLNSGLGGFWTGSANSVYRVSMAGAVISQIPANNVIPTISGIIGCTYDPYSTPGNNKLWFFARDGFNHCTFHEFSPQSLSFTGITHDAFDIPGVIPGANDPSSLAGSCTASSTLVPGKFVLIGIIQNSLTGSTHSPVFGYQLANTVNFNGDIGISALISPTSNTSLGSSEQVTVQISNFGTQVQTNFPVSFSFQGGAPFSGTYSGTPIPPGGSANFTFASVIDMSVYSTYSINACTGMLLDQNTGNDCKSFYINHNIPSLSDTLYPSNISYATGTTNGISFTQNSLIQSYGNSTSAGWARFDISPLSNVAIINSVQLRMFYTAPWYFPYFQIRHLNIDPLTSSPSVMMNAIADASNQAYLSYYGGTSAPLAYIAHLLPSTANTDIQGAIPQGWFALGIREFEYNNGYYLTAQGWQGPNRPQLIVNHSNPVNHDAGVVSVDLAPFGMADQAYFPKATIHNYGLSSENNIPVHITGPNGYSQTLTIPSMNPGQTIQLTFPSGSFTAGTNRCFSVCTQMTGDMVGFNNCKMACMQFDAVLTQAFGIIASSTNMPIGPCSFYLEHPDVITSLAPSSHQPISGGAWANGQWYVNELIIGNNIHGHLYRVNTSTGIMTDIGPLGGVSIQAMAFDHTTNTMYGVSTIPSTSQGSYIVKIYTINLITGAATFAVSFGNLPGNIISLACNNAGMLFANDISGNKIWAIDPMTWTCEMIGPSGLSLAFPQGASFDNSNDVYYHSTYQTSGSSNLYKCDPGSGTMTFVGAFQGNSRITGFAIPYNYTSPVCDIGCQWLKYPKSGNTGNYELVSVKLRNYGTQAVSNFDICYKFANQAVQCENWATYVGTIFAPGATYEYSFLSTVDCGSPGDYPIKVWINPVQYSLGDINQINDTTKKTIHNDACQQISCFPSAITEAESCGTNSNGGCNPTGQNAFVDILNGQTYCGTTWKIDTLRDSDWYRFVLTGTKIVNIKAKAEMNCDFFIIKSPCIQDSLIAFKTFSKCRLDSLISINLAAGTYALVVAHNWGDYNTTCQGKTKYTFTFQIFPGRPCIPGGLIHGPTDEFIQNITIVPGTINNTSNYSTNGYGDYTNLSTEMTIGQAYTISMNNGGDPQWWNLSYSAVWVDWNQNLSFNDPGEKVTMSPNPGNPSSGVIVPPANALPGPTRLRAMTAWAVYPPGPPDPCATYPYSEAEDYSVNVNLTHPAVITRAPTIISHACPGQKIVPITVENCTDINAITLTLALNTFPVGNTVTYLGYQNANPQLAGNLTVSSSSGIITINWYNTSHAANIVNGTLLELVLNVQSDTTYLSWMTGPSYCNYISGQTGLVPDCIYVNGKLAFDHCQNVSGKVRYKHFDGTALHPYFFKDSVTMQLLQANTVMYSCPVLPDSGKFLFSNVNFGTYILTAVSDNGPLHKTKLWGGGNATDALFILRNFVGFTPPLTGLQLTVADVNGSGGVPNSADALAIAKRFVGVISNFQIPNVSPPGGPDWYWEKYTISINGLANIKQNIYGLCAGDVNGSYYPINTSYAPAKESPTVSLKILGELGLETGFTYLPIFIEHAMTVGSVSLVMNYPKEMEIKGVSFTHASENMVYAASDGILKVAWFSLDPLQLSAGEVLLTLKVHAESNPEKEWIFSLSPESSLSDADAITIDNASLFMPELVAGRPGACSLSIFPNPFSTTSGIHYSIPKDAHITLEIFNILGEEMAMLVNARQTAGNYSVNFNRAGLKSGVYFCKLQVDDITKVNSMIITE